MRIKDLHGIGPKTVEMLDARKIKTISMLAETPVRELMDWFGENKGKLIHEKANGVDESEVEEREKQQYSRIITLKEDTSSDEMLVQEAIPLAEELAKRSIENKILFRTISIIMVSNKLESLTRSKTLEGATQSADEISKTTKELLRTFFGSNQGFVCRRFGVGVSNFEELKKGSNKQKTIFDFSGKA